MDKKNTVAWKRMVRSRLPKGCKVFYCQHVDSGEFSPRLIFYAGSEKRFVCCVICARVIQSTIQGNFEKADLLKETFLSAIATKQEMLYALVCREAEDQNTPESPRAEVAEKEAAPQSWSEKLWHTLTNCLNR